LGDERAELLAVLLARAVVAGRVLAADAEGARDVVLGDDEEGLDAELADEITFDTAENEPFEIC